MNFRNYLAVLLLSSMILLENCTPAAKTKTVEQQKTENIRLKAPADKALVYMLCTFSGVFFDKSFDIKCDNRDMGSIGANQFIYAFLEPGVHNFEAIGHKGGKSFFELEAGKVHFLELTVGDWFSQTKLERISPTDGLLKRNKCKLSSDCTSCREPDKPDQKEETIVNPAPRPLLVFVDPRFEHTRNAVKLTVTLSNNGNMAAQKVRVQLSPQTETGEEKNIELLEPGAGEDITLLWYPPQNATDPILDVGCTAQANKAQAVADTTFSLRWLNDPSATAIRWLHPEEDTTMVGIEAPNPELKVEVVSTSPIESEHITQFTGIRRGKPINLNWTCGEPETPLSDRFKAVCSCNLPIEPGINKVRVRATNLSGTEETEERYFIKPNLVFENPQFVHGYNTIKMNVTLANKGETPLKNVEINFVPNNDGGEVMSVDYLERGASYNLTYVWTPPRNTTDSILTVACEAREERAQSVVKNVFSHQWRHSPRLTTISWLEEPLQDSTRIDRDKFNTELKVYVESSDPIESGQIEAKIWEEAGEKGRKAYRFKCKETDRGRPDRFRAEASCTLPIEPGFNNVSVIVRRSDTIEAETKIHCFVQPQNLYLISTGIKSDLKWTTSDAEDFHREIVNQERKLYSKVDALLLNTPETTTRNAILKNIQNLRERYYKKEIRDNDLIILFFSSHGFQSRDKFWIEPSDFDPTLIEDSSIDFKEEILYKLQDVGKHCHVLIFVDACQSDITNNDVVIGKGNVDDISMGKVSKVISELINTEKTIRIINSCQPGKSSYEARTWKNGAFTEALIEAFTNSLVVVEDKKPPTHADANGDLVLTIYELFEFLRLRVPFLVQNEKQGKTQTPYFIEYSPEKRDKDIPIYSLPRR